MIVLIIIIVIVACAIWFVGEHLNETNYKSNVSIQNKTVAQERRTPVYKAMFTCPDCRARVSQESTRCNSCGTSLEKYVTYYKNAQRGNSEAQIVLGMFYRQGIYVEKNLEKGFYWTKEAADSGNSHAKLGVACCYLDGLGVEQNFTRAIYWLVESKRGGDLDAAKKLHQLGIIDAQFIGGEDGLISITHTK